MTGTCRSRGGVEGVGCSVCLQPQIVVVLDRIGYAGNEVGSTRHTHIFIPLQPCSRSSTPRVGLAAVAATRIKLPSSTLRSSSLAQASTSSTTQNSLVLAVADHLVVCPCPTVARVVMFKRHLQIPSKLLTEGESSSSKSMSFWFGNGGVPLLYNGFEEKYGEGGGPGKRLTLRSCSRRL